VVADVHVIVPLTIGHCGLFDYPGDHKTQLLREWVGLAVADDALMVAAILLSTCRYILQVQPGNLIFLRLALQYKQICLQTLRQEVDNSSAPVNTMTVAKALALALDEVMPSGPHGTTGLLFFLKQTTDNFSSRSRWVNTLSLGNI
jgi:hypothetical protein